MKKTLYFFNLGIGLQNRLIKTTRLNGKLVVEYNYDLLGRRTTKETPETTISYIYAGHNAIQENITDIQTQETTTRENIFSNNLDDILLTIVTNPDLTTKQLYYTKNHLNSTIAITDETGTILEEYIYDVFGKAYIRDGNSTNHREFKSSPSGITRLYTGREYETETNLYYLRARYYSPVTGRFINRDPIDISDDTNLYSYVGNNGVMFVDLMGREKSNVVPYEYSIGQQIVLTYTDGYGVVVRGLVEGLGVEQAYAPGSITEIKEPIETVNYSVGQEFVIMGVGFISPGKKGDILDDVGDIVNGHAFKNHINEFKDYGVETLDDLEKFAKDLIDNSFKKGNVKELGEGRTVIWDEKTKGVLFHDPNSKDKGTIFIQNPNKTNGRTLLEYIDSKF